ncbi:hypothetical protein Q0Z83_009730 [Actinoplanes sichuanensis]|uniref:Uncharacterized protein n=1 Tax=Actinoplanes sichuanensis TaxID=512349 RepID=A0ABW4AGC8_9ACTN|nr:hypothetical protein [Actinoplanes sichuanensis]BEL02782.1 hypothetical protein Q0Z83_009730 [Actinoplanes sichuanensis]
MPATENQVLTRDVSRIPATAGSQTSGIGIGPAPAADGGQQPEIKNNQKPAADGSPAPDIESNRVTGSDFARIPFAGRSRMVALRSGIKLLTKISEALGSSTSRFPFTRPSEGPAAVGAPAIPVAFHNVVNEKRREVPTYAKIAARLIACNPTQPALAMSTRPCRPGPIIATPAGVIISGYNSAVTVPRRRAPPPPRQYRPERPPTITTTHHPPSSHHHPTTTRHHPAHHHPAITVPH